MMKLAVCFAMLLALARATTNDPDVCTQPKASGRCFAYMLRWYFNTTAGTCQEFVYGGCGGNANRFMSRAACERHCPDTPTSASTPAPTSAPTSAPVTQFPVHCAGRPMCMMFCRTGFMTGEDGCPICRCNPPPCAGKPICRMLCPNGFQNGEDGCPICQCNPSRVPEEPKPTCADRACYIYCPFGNVLDAGGCRTCRCNPPRCRQRLICPRVCFNGFKNGVDGCPICECNPNPQNLPVIRPEQSPFSPMPRINCANRPICYIHCPFGHVLDAEGCRTCRCKPSPNPNPCHNMPPCDLRCPSGFAKHPNGCKKCQCKSAPMPLPCAGRPACLNRCLFGREMDTDGCPTCTCKQLQQVCYEKPMCKMYCHMGYVMDSDGCPTCRCLRLPEARSLSIEHHNEEADAQENSDVLEAMDQSLPNVCSEPRLVGPCRARLPRWYYDVTSGACQRFFFGGCRANGNNFYNQADCEATCRHH